MELSPAFITLSAIPMVFVNVTQGQRDERNGSMFSKQLGMTFLYHLKYISSECYEIYKSSIKIIYLFINIMNKFDINILPTYKLYLFVIIKLSQ